MEQRLLALGKVFWLVLGERYGDFATVNYGRTWLPSKISAARICFYELHNGVPLRMFHLDP